ncbi:hypothetical protein SH501x_004156 [Pirellulaceae bacterium SH501]
MNPRLAIGKSSPLGAEITNHGVNFSLFSRTANGVDLLLFDREDDAKPARVIALDPVANRTYHYWHTFVEGLKPGQLYGYRVHGPEEAAKGMRFNPSKVLLDPYGRGVIVPKGYSPHLAKGPGDNVATAMKSVLVDLESYDWEGDVPLKLPSSRTIIYEMHVDGFRFDLASILSRDSSGQVLPNPPVLWDIESEPVLAGAKLIAEAWDAGGLYQVGSFVGDAWKEWNGRFRDDARDFFRGELGSVGRLADRMLGSHEIYGHKHREPEQSVNFVTCHDGFTLNDLVSYNEKHNESNGEENRDGANDNKSWNCGQEGPTADPAIESLRNQQVKNFHAVTMLSLGVPMILMGDEVRRTQAGNNNGYCHDDESTWFDWSLVQEHAEIHRFVKLLIARRLLRDVTHEQQRLSLTQLIQNSTKSWHGVRLNQPDWGRDSHSIAFSAELREEGILFHLILNGYWESLDFELPTQYPESPWKRWIDTSLPSPLDIVDWQAAPEFVGNTYRSAGRSVVLVYKSAAPTLAEHSV